MLKSTSRLPTPHHTSWRPHSPAAFTLVEVLVALSVLLLGITGVAALNSSALALTRSAKQSTAASLCLQERIEQLRIANWQQVTDATYLRDSVFSIAPRNTAGLAPVIETITISAYPDAATTEPVKLRKTTNGVTVVSAGATISDEAVAKLDLQIQWTGKDGRARTRESSTILSRAGISRLNLSGPQTGGTSTPPASPTPTPSNNGQGRGNAGGKPGTK